MALFGLIPDISSTVQLKMTPDEAKREAIGKALSLLGTTIGITGTIMALSVNPAIKAESSGAYSKLPKTMQDNKVGTLIVVGLLGAAAAYWYISRGMKKNNAKYIPSP